MKKKNFVECVKLVFVWLGAGAINGFFGAGAGLLIVPTIGLICKDESKKVHATTMVCVLFMSMVSSIFYICTSSVDFGIVIPSSIGGIVGGILGTFLLKNLKNDVIDLIFSFVLIVAGILMIIL